MIKNDLRARQNPLSLETKEKCEILSKVLLISKLQEPITLEKRGSTIKIWHQNDL
jgi:hypothetical protein